MSNANQGNGTAAPETLPRPPDPEDRPPSSPWFARGVEDVYFQREAQITWWTVLGGVAVGGLLTQLPQVVSQAQAGRWQLVLYSLATALIIALSWIQTTWGTLVLKWPLSVPGTLIGFFVGLSQSILSLQVTQPSAWMFAACLVAVGSVLAQLYFQKSGAWAVFSPPHVARLRGVIWIHAMFAGVALGAALLLNRFPSPVHETLWGLAGLAMTLAALWLQDQGMKVEKCALGIPWSPRTPGRECAMTAVSIQAWLLLVLLLPACQSPAATPPVSPTNLPPTPSSPGPALGSLLTVTPTFQTLPAGSSAKFGLAVGPPGETHRYAFHVDELPAGWAAEFLGSPTPYNETVVLTAGESARPGPYHIRVVATSEAALSASGELSLEVVPCVEFQSGEFTQAVHANLVQSITAGKPSIEHGLLIPLQVCGGRPGRRLLVTLVEVISEAGSRMTAPPRFYLYRSWMWPEPHSIVAHGVPGTLNVKLPRIENEAWQLQADVAAGLYLLLFERDYYGSSPDPQAIPATVTYRLSIVP